MEMQSLKRWRYLVPGVVILLFLYLPSIRDPLLSLATFSKSIAAVVLGVLYELSGLRYYFLRPSHLTIKQSITERLLRICGPDPTIDQAKAALSSGRELILLFYRLVDSDRTLTAKSKRVYFNGLLWSSAVDLIALGTFSSLFYWGWVVLVAPTLAYIWIAAGLAILAFLTHTCLLPRIVHRHLTLANHQLDYIDLFLRPTLCAQLRSLASRFTSVESLAPPA